MVRISSRLDLRLSELPKAQAHWLSPLGFRHKLYGHKARIHRRCGVLNANNLTGESGRG